ncbi:MAG: hypothetical protein E7235_03720 [Lachnospiraceae bacterium]|nr:hypothetical protein [Lachnospiraceae bacterium]
MEKKALIAVAIIIAAILLIPIPMRLKDGGTVVYKALLYQISDVHSLNPDITSDEPYIDGTIIKILGVEIFNNTDK